VIDLGYLKQGISAHPLGVLLGISAFDHLSQDDLDEPLLKQAHLPGMLLSLDQLSDAEDDDLEDVLIVDVIIYDVFVHGADDDFGEGGHGLHWEGGLVLADEDDHEGGVFGEGDHHLLQEDVGTTEALLRKQSLLLVVFETLVAFLAFIAREAAKGLVGSEPVLAVLKHLP
jgi:hypothetical protein